MSSGTTAGSWRQVRAVAFDLDDTLAPSKSLVPDETARLLSRLVQMVPVCVISGGRFEQFRDQLLAQLPAASEGMSRLHLMPTCGTRYYRWLGESRGWELIYHQDLTPEQRQRAAEAIETAARELDLWEPDTWVSGARIEDRGSQMTFSALGQQAGVAEKKAWDPSGARRRQLASRIAHLLPDLEVRSGGSTSIDITGLGIDKAFGIERFLAEIGVLPEHLLFVGDRLQPEGNDYPVLRLGVQARQVADHHETVVVLRELLATLGSEPS